jgi:hypothetical protein
VSKWVDENYINRLSAEDARRELLLALEFQHGLLDAIKNQAELPDPWVLTVLDQAALWPADKGVGLMLQRKHGLDAVPPVTECENGAGLWWRILQGLKTERPSALPE